MLIFNYSNKKSKNMKKHINEVIRQAGEHSETKITEMVMIHFRDLGFELVKTKHLKKQAKKQRNQNRIIDELIHENYAMSKALINAGIATVDALIPDTANPISTQARTAGARQGAEAIDAELDAIINSLDSHINAMTKTLDDANLTRIKFELDEQERLLDEPMETTQDPAMDEAVDLYMYYLQLHHTPYQARLMALLTVKEKVEGTGYDSYYIDVYNHLKLLKFTM
jgi:hypothetical protein